MRNDLIHTVFEHDRPVIDVSPHEPIGEAGASPAVKGEMAFSPLRGKPTDCMYGETVRDHPVKMDLLRFE